VPRSYADYGSLAARLIDLLDFLFEAASKFPGEVSGLYNNFQKTSLVSIRCALIDLDDIFDGLLVEQDIIPTQAPWATPLDLAAYDKGFSSQLNYLLTPLINPPNTLHSTKKIERAFLWADTDNISGGNCKVNWVTVCAQHRVLRESPLD
jgi:hypothetical protein